MTNDKLETQFKLYIDELIEWNKKFNLTAVTNPDEIRTRHFEDSLSILQAIDLKNEKVVDVGAGAGFPGIPLKIARPDIRLTIVEATKKKTEFLKHLINVLGLKDAEVVWGRAEEISRSEKYKEKFDVAVARAVALLPELIKYCVPFLNPKGVFIAQKSDAVDEEISGSAKSLKAFKAEIKEIKKVEVGGVQRSLVVIKRI